MAKSKELCLSKDAIGSILCCVFSVALSLFILQWCAAAGEDTLRVLLRPYAKAAEVFYHIPLHYVSGTGYVYGAFAIGRECLGVRMTMLLFCMHACVFVRRFHGFQKPLWVGAAFAGSVLAGFFINSLRILGSIPFVHYEKFATLHTLSGIALHLLALYGSYLLVSKMLSGRKKAPAVHIKSQLRCKV